MTYDLLESSQSPELSFNSRVPGNFFSKSTSCVIVIASGLSDILIFIKPYEAHNPCIYLLPRNYLHLTQSFL